MKRSTNLSRGHTARLTTPAVADLMGELGITLDDLYPVYELLLPGGAIVEQRGVSMADAARRYAASNPDAPRAVGARRKP